MDRTDEEKKMQAARISVAAALLLSLVKVTAGLMFRSLGMVSAGVDSLMDLISSSINYFSMKKSVKPADSDHPYGHGKIENIASLFQALILAFMGLMLIGEGVRQMLYVKDVPDFDAGIFVMVLSGLASYWVGKRLLQVSHETDSPLLKADSYHFTMDTYTNVGVAAALVLANWTHLIIFDRLVAIMIGTWVLFASYKIFRDSFDDLIDKNIPEEIKKEIHGIILSHSPEILSYHKMRTRRAGGQKLIDLHLVTCREKSLAQAHSISDHIEKEIESKIKNADVIIHTEPCMAECPSNIHECEFLPKS